MDSKVETTTANIGLAILLCLKFEMKYETHLSGTTKIADFTIDDTRISTAQDALECLMHLRYEEGADRMMVGIENLDPQFFDLKSGLAGDILQKFSNYGGYLAIVGDFSAFESRSLRDFMWESNRQGRIFFVENTAQAIECLDR